MERPLRPVDGTYQAFQGCVGIGSTADNVSVGVQQVDAGWWFWSYAHLPCEPELRLSAAHLRWTG